MIRGICCYHCKWGCSMDEINAWCEFHDEDCFNYDRCDKFEEKVIMND